MARTITVTQRKGGVGKTTKAVHLAIAAAANGYNVAVVDMDSQGHVSKMFDMKIQDAIFEMVVLEKSVFDVLQEVPADMYSNVVKDRIPGRLSLLAGGDRTDLAAMDIQRRGEQFGLLKELLFPLNDEYDLIIIDTPPSVSSFTSSIIEASNYIMIPTELSRFSFDGINQVIRLMNNIGAIHNATILGIIPMMVQPNTLEHADRMDELKQEYGDLVWDDVAISRSIVWSEAADAAMSIFEYVPDHKSSKQMWALYNKMMKVWETA